MVKEVWEMLYVHIIFLPWGFTIPINTQGKRLKVDQFSSFLLQSAQGSTYFLQYNTTLLVKETVYKLLPSIYDVIGRKSSTCVQVAFLHFSTD